MAILLRSPNVLSMSRPTASQQTVKTASASPRNQVHRRDWAGPGAMCDGSESDFNESSVNQRSKIRDFFVLV